MRRERELWTHYDPIHAVCYFAPETFAAFEAAGLNGFWRGYFTSRAAPLGAVGAEPVIAAFYGFAPPMVRRAFPELWSRISPETALDVRREAAGRTLRRLAPDAPFAEIADVLERAVDSADLAGRVLGAANAGLPRPDDDAERVYVAATALRELRGDGHIAALVAYGIGPCQSLALRSGTDVPREHSQPARGWTDEEWDAATVELRERGLVDEAGTMTEAGTALREAVEAATDDAAAAPWRSFSDEDVADALALLRPVTVACLPEVPTQIPLGLPRIA